MKNLFAILAILFSTVALASEQEIGFTGLAVKAGQMIVIKIHTPIPQLHAFVVQNDVVETDKIGVRAGDVKPGNYKVDVTVRESALSNTVVFSRTETVTVE